MAKVLVTGATGFIGQHLVRRLLDENYTVRAMKHGTGKLHFFKNEEVEWWEADLGNKGTLKGICKKVDIVYHCAAISRNDLSKTWDDFDTINIKGTKFLLQEAETSGVKRFVFVSTVEAAGYGDGINPRKETDTPNPINNYGKSKLEAEKIVMNSEWNMACVTLRLPMIYGPGTFLIVPKLFGMVKRGFYPFIGDGLALMEFCYVDNAVEAILLAGKKKQAAGETFYVSDERSYTIKEVIKHISTAMNVRPIFLYIPKFMAYTFALFFELIAKKIPFPPIISPVSRKPFFTRETVFWTTKNVNVVSTEKIKRVLGYKPVVSIGEGCTRTATWLKSYLK